MPAQVIKISGARQHNLKNLHVQIPREKLAVITGLSGSGKSSLAFDTLYAEGQRRYVESLSAYARQFLDQMEKPNVADIFLPASTYSSKSISAGAITGKAKLIARRRIDNRIGIRMTAIILAQAKELFFLSWFPMSN